MDQESFTPAQLDQLFNIVAAEPTFYHRNDNEASENLDFNFDLETYSTPPEFPDRSTTPAPDLFDYNFGQPSSGYSTPGPNTPHPYPIEQQQCHNSNLAVRQRPQVLRSQTNTSYLRPSHPPPQYTRRRSLSQGDAERIVLIEAPPNPTFLRLQNPRARTIGSDEHLHKRRAGSHKHGHIRSASQGLNDDRSTWTNTSMSTPYNPRPLDDMIPTYIGRPLSPVSPRYHRPATVQRRSIHYEHSGQDVTFRQMTTLDQMERSRRIIEIGAMTVNPPLQPILQNNNSSILNKLEEVEQYLKRRGEDFEDELKGCIVIRQALTRKLSEAKHQDGA